MLGHTPIPQSPLLVRPIRVQEVQRWRDLIHQRHYLHSARIGGKVLRYVATRGDEWIALIGWGSAALKCTARDRYIGWDTETKEKRLFLIVNNVRFLMLVRERNLASQVLAQNLRRLPQDWQRVYGHPVYLAETFVDPIYRGTCYRASNWIGVGVTQGWSKKGGRWERNDRPKAVYVYPLCEDAREKLRAEFIPVRKGKTCQEGDMVVKMKGIAVEGLMEQIRQVKDPRHPRGVRHAFAGIVGIAVCAVFCGARSFRAIAQWGKSLREADLRRFATGRHESPSEPTIRRVLQSIDAEEFDRQIGGWVESQQSVEGKGVAVDGKTLRGSAAGGGAAVHLLSAVVHKEGVVLAQQNVGEKTNEIPCVKPMLEGVRLEGAVVTADALLTQRELATHLVEKKGADYIFTVKGNQPTMEKDIEDLGLEKKTADFRTFDKEHGRNETRQIWVSSELNGYLNFPYVGQVFVIDRKFVYRSGKIKQETNYGVTSLSAEKASAERLMKLIRGHWEIENRLHYVRDVTFDEDRSQVRTKNGARVMASIRNLVISVCRLLGFQFIADALRHFMYRKEESFEVLGI